MMIETEDRTKRFDEVTAVDSLTLQVADGEVLGVLGPNWAGKRTTIWMLASLISRTSGTARVAGCDLGDPVSELRLSAVKPVGFDNPTEQHRAPPSDDGSLGEARRLLRTYGLQSNERSRS